MSALMPESLQKDDDEDSDDADPLKDLTGENEDPSEEEGDVKSLPDAIGTDEDEASRQQDAGQSGTGYQDIQRQAIDALIENQDKIKDIMNNDSSDTNAGRE